MNCSPSACPLSLFILFCLSNNNCGNEPCRPNGCFHLIIRRKPSVWYGRRFLSEMFHTSGLNGPYPSALYSIINLIISLVLVILLPMAKRNKNIAIYFVFSGCDQSGFLSIFFSCSALISLFCHRFLRIIREGRDKHVDVHPFYIGHGLFAVACANLSQDYVDCFHDIYSFVFGTLRYIIFLFILSKFRSFIWRFCFLYLVLLLISYTLSEFIVFYNSKLAHNLKGSESVWKWSY